MMVMNDLVRYFRDQLTHESQIKSCPNSECAKEFASLKGWLPSAIGNSTP